MQVVWNWRAPDKRPGTGQTIDRAGLRRAAVLQALITGAVAAFLIHGLGHMLVGRVIASIAVVVLFLGLSLPGVYHHVHRFGRTLGRAVGTALVHVLLVPFFYLFFLPVALWLRLRGRDPLHRTWRESRFTYWASRTPQEPAQNIDRLFLREDRAARSQLRPVGSLPVRDAQPRTSEDDS